MAKPKPYTFDNFFFDLLMKYLYLESYGLLYYNKFININIIITTIWEVFKYEACVSLDY